MKTKTIPSQAEQECSEGVTTRAWSPERTVKPQERAAVKTCKVCGETKPLSGFYQAGRTCRVCYLARCKIYNARPENIERRHKRQKAHYAANKDRINKERKKRLDSRPERKKQLNEYGRKHYVENKHLYVAKLNQRRAAKLKATPKWADRHAIKQFYLMAQDMTKRTGKKYVVDHVIPLQSKIVCGLHVHTNLQVIPELENWKKASRFTGEIVCSAQKCAEVWIKSQTITKGEYTVVRNYGSSAGGSGTGRAMASMESWIHSNYAKSTTTTGYTNTGFSSGTVAAPTDGSTNSALTEAVLKTALGNAWTNGGNARVILCNTTNKAAIDGFSGVAVRQVNVANTSQATIIGAANVYVSSYGVHTVVLHRHVRGNVVIGVDPDYWAMAWLRNPFMEQMAKTGDGTKYMMRAEGTLVCRNEKASTMAVGLT